MCIAASKQKIRLQHVVAMKTMAPNSTQTVTKNCLIFAGRKDIFHK